MRFNRLGRSGLDVSAVGLGCNNFGGRVDATGTERVVGAALDAGITLFDTADIYGAGRSEEFLGRALGNRRDQAVIATKFGGQMPGGAGASRGWIVRAVEDSLRRLGTDHIDLYQLHFPDQRTPLEETLHALDDLVHQGKVRYLGSSNFAGWQIAEADWIARSEHLERFISAQNEYSLVDRAVEAEVIPACTRYGVGMLPYFPLASGVLTGKYRRGENPPPGTRLGGGGERSRFLSDRNLDVVEGLETVARESGVSLLDVAIGGLAAQPQVTSVIAGATGPEQVRANVEAGEWQPDEGARRAIDKVAAPPPG